MLHDHRVFTDGYRAILCRENGTVKHTCTGSNSDVTHENGCRSNEGVRVDVGLETPVPHQHALSAIGSSRV